VALSRTVTGSCWGAGEPKADPEWLLIPKATMSLYHAFPEVGISVAGWEKNVPKEG
jgi:hypothetical protein